MKWHDIHSPEAKILAPVHPIELKPFADGSPPMVARCADYAVGAGSNGIFAFIHDRRYNFLGWWEYTGRVPLSREDVLLEIGYGNLRKKWFVGRTWEHRELQV